MKIWHDDLGLQDDQHEMKVLYQSEYFPHLPVWSTVTRGDCAVCAMGPSAWGGVFPAFFSTVYDLMLIGF